MNKRAPLFFLVLLLSACGTSYYYAEFIYPSKVYIPSDLYKVGIVNRAATPSTAAEIRSDGEVIDYAPGMAFRTAGKVVNAIIAENEYMGRYKIETIDWDKSLPVGSIKPGKELSLNQADSICLWDLVDGLIIIEGIDMSVDVHGDVSMVDAYDDFGNMIRVPEFTARTDISMAMRFRFYDYVRKEFIDDYVENYTFDASQVYYNEQDARNFKPREVSTKELALIVAVDYYSRIAPFWMEDYRLYYQTGSSDMYRIANTLEYDGDWQQAANEWKTLADDPNERIAYRARYNMAVAKEMMGEPKLAKEWLQKAEELKTTKHTTAYMERLATQILLYEVVSAQLGIPIETSDDEDESASDEVSSGQENSGAADEDTPSDSKEPESDEQDED